MKNLAVFFANYPLFDFHLDKDVGLFPIYLKKHYFDSVTLLKAGSKQEADFMCRGIRVSNLFVSEQIYKNCKNTLFDQLRECRHAIKYIKGHKEITHVMFFHFHFISNLYFSYRIKKIRPDIKIYCKLDTAEDGANDILRQLDSSRTAFLKSKFLRSVDFVSVETSSPLAVLQGSRELKDKLYLVPNGIDMEKYPAPDFSEKENLVITVGRLGSYQKNTELMLSILKEVELKDWKVVLVGGIEMQEQDFSRSIEKFFVDNPALKDTIVFTGNIADKELLASYYNRAKVFLFTSRFESFGLALQEAAYYGDYIVSTDVGCARDITDGGKLGFVTEHSTELHQDEAFIKESMVSHLSKIISGEIDISLKHEAQSAFVRENYTMDKVVCRDLFMEFCEGA